MKYDSLLYQLENLTPEQLGKMKWSCNCPFATGSLSTAVEGENKDPYTNERPALPPLTKPVDRERRVCKHLIALWRKLGYHLKDGQMPDGNRVEGYNRPLKSLRDPQSAMDSLSDGGDTFNLSSVEDFREHDGLPSMKVQSRQSALFKHRVRPKPL